MVRLRLRRVGAKAQPSYRIVAADKESPRDGRFIEILGSYNPRTDPATISIKEDRVYDWLSKGAQPSESVAQVFKSAGLLERYERFKKGEALETLLAEAEAAEKARNINPKTERTAPAKK
ncbi:MAG: 30S ribosomal protein S16 [Anaerolineales bacterium]|jgi:small subunit ribosomal protein S16|nr:30S ribosomal protein S16 [Anaerolineales bacterium]